MKGVGNVKFWALISALAGLLLVGAPSMAADPEHSRLSSGSDKSSSVGSNAEQNGRWRISSGSKWEEMAAYSRAVVEGDWVFVSGTVGFAEDSSIPEQFDVQMDNIFTNIESVLEQAGSSLQDIVRVRCFLVDTKYVEAMSRKLRQYLDDVRPTNTTIITALAPEGALIEIEVTALKQSD